MTIYDICLNKENCICKGKNDICFLDINKYCDKQKTIQKEDDNE